MEWLVGVLAFATLIIAIVFVAGHFIKQLDDPKNKAAAKSVLVDDDSSATTAVRGGETPEHLK